MFELILEPGRPPVALVPAGDPTAHRDAVSEAVRLHGCVLVRGLGVVDQDGALAAARAFTGARMAEREPFAVRTMYGNGLYSSTEWPADQPMCMHHELSYARWVPSRMVFCCLRAPVSGGAVALADGSAVLESLDSMDPALVARFAAHGWELRRNYHDVLGIDWPAAFAVTDREDVEKICAQDDVEVRWGDDGTLHTRRVCPAVITHPQTGRPVWFNQVAFLNEWTTDPAVREYLLAEFGPHGLPFTTLSGDGQALEESTVERINECYHRHTVREPWRAGDVLVLDNLRMAHSRDPYQGERQVAVALGDPVRIGPQGSVSRS